MNRKERRKRKIDTKVKTYTLTETELKKYKERAEAEAIDKSFVIQVYSSMMVLRDKGWGRKRLTEFVESVIELYDSVSKDYLDFVDMIETIEEETGININIFE